MTLRRNQLAMLAGAIERVAQLDVPADAALYAAKHRGRNAVVEHGFVRANEGGNGASPSPWSR